jgi:exportin-1
VKKAVLRLVEVFIEKCEDDTLLITKFVPALMEPVLGDYAGSVPDARWVLSARVGQEWGISSA